MPGIIRGALIGMVFHMHNREVGRHRLFDKPADDAAIEDLLNHNFAEPVSGILPAIKPDEQFACRIEVTVRPASSPTRTTGIAPKRSPRSKT